MLIQKKLTQKYVDSKERCNAAATIKDTITPNLYLVVNKTINSFSFRGSKDNKRVRHNIGASSLIKLHLARERADELARELAAGNLSKSISLEYFHSTIYSSYMEQHKRNTGPERSKINTHIIPRFGKTLLNKITRQAIVEFSIELSDKGLRPATVNRIISSLQKMLSLAVEHNLLSTSPAKGLKTLTENNVGTRVLIGDERPQFLNACKVDSDPIAADALTLDLYTGARIGEIISLTKSQVAQDLSSIYLPQTKSGKPFNMLLNSAAQDVIKRCLARTWNQYLFPSTVKDGYPISYPRGAFKRICEAAGITDLKIHDLRRTFASICVNAGGDIYATAKLLNHSNISVTERYAHFKDAHLVATSERTLEAMLGEDYNPPS
jgi:integrase